MGYSWEVVKRIRVTCISCCRHGDMMKSCTFLLLLLHARSRTSSSSNPSLATTCLVIELVVVVIGASRLSTLIVSHSAYTTTLFPESFLCPL